jgi:hypothetical protein
MPQESLISMRELGRRALEVNSVPAVQITPSCYNHGILPSVWGFGQSIAIISIALFNSSLYLALKPTYFLFLLLHI